MLINVLVFFTGFLIFQIQPLSARMILPQFGGGASIWLTAVFFFQFFLFLGYFLSHLVRRKWSTKKHICLEIILLLLSMILLPLGLFSLPSQSLALPLQIFLLLSTSLGLPFLVLASLSPLLQHWSAIEGQKKNPYILYGSSNLGSLLGLLTYPFVFEPNFTLTEQKWIWSGSYLFLAILVVFFVVPLWKKAPPFSPKDSVVSSQTLSRKIRWIYSAFLPSAFLLAVTHYLIRDIANFPFLWVVPLVFYLLSFVLVFYFPRLSQKSRWRYWLCCFPLWFLLLYSLSPYYLLIHRSLIYPTILGCGALFGLALYLHGDLERLKPPAEELTTFYLYLCLGGALGGFFVSFVAPVIFSSNYEFYLLLWMGIFTLSLPHSQKWAKTRRLLYFTTMMTLFTMNFYMEMTDWHPQILRKARSFYNSYRIVEVKSPFSGQPNIRLLVHGNTVHGGEVRGEKQSIRLTYYHRKSGISKIMTSLADGKKIAVVGLGAGVMASFGKKHQQMDFYEIDPLMEKLAREYFTFLSKASCQVRVYLGDGRKELEKRTDQAYDLIVVDGFASDSVPTHLITLEAVQTYLRLLKPQGMMVFNISNRFLDLWPVLNGSAQKLHLNIGYSICRKNQKNFIFAAQWAVLTPSLKTLDDLGWGWKPKNNQTVIWTDELNSLWPLLEW